MVKRKIIMVVVTIFVVIGSVLGTLLFTAVQRHKKYKEAQANADYVIENFDKEFVLKEFPAKNFPDRGQLQTIVKKMADDCDWKHRDGKFVDFFLMRKIGGAEKTSFIYEYYLKCDSIRIILSYDLEKDDIELLRLDIQPLEEPNKMILFPEKQLKNRRQ